LKKYIDTEQGRMPAEQIPVPHLTEVVQVYEGLRDSLETRHTGTTTRKTGVAGTYEVGEALLDFLQAAAMHLIMNDFDRKVTPELGLWGFDVIARPAKSNGNGSAPISTAGLRPADLKHKDHPARGHRRATGPALREEMSVLGLKDSIRRGGLLAKQRTRCHETRHKLCAAKLCVVQRSR
jgi:hypothetical protein